ncbi:TIGR04211 family SH3 domain-containing protein [Methylophaga sp.]|uniref:TIGR04211 family SH3 domain-containing protein n=1 Tax=Methylophaga sp. TaxID=2024840 RepID=UPI003F6996B1
MKKLISRTLIAALLCMPFFAIAQTTRYVSDELEITMRNGQGVQFGIRKMLESGTRLDVLETDPAGYSKVRTSEGVEGWVLTRYLSNTPSARDQLESSQQRVANLELEIAKYKEEISTLSSQNSDVDTKNLTLKEKSQRLSKELDNLRRTASNAVALENENRQLKEKLQEIDHENQSLVIENNALKDNSTRRWFLIGAAVLFSGIILGLILPRLRIRKKDSWGSL